MSLEYINHGICLPDIYLVVGIFEYQSSSREMGTTSNVHLDGEGGVEALK